MEAATAAMSPERWGASYRAVCLILLSLTAALALTGCSDKLDLKAVDKSVVRVQYVFEYRGKKIPGAHGTGFVLDREGYVVTNRHVVDVKNHLPAGVKALQLFVPDGSWDKRLPAKVVWSSEKYDLAILHVPGLHRPPVVLANVKPLVSPEKGEKVYAIGFPGAGDVTGSQAALQSTISEGTVSKVTLGRGSAHGAERMIVQHSAYINLGNSGGPLFNECGQVIAVNTFAATSTFHIVRKPNGQIIARGSAVSGVYYSPHVASLIEILTTEPALRNVRFQSSAAVCVPDSGTPIGMYVAFALVALLAIASMILAMVRKRGPAEVVRVVETYSQWIRRRGGRAPHGREALSGPTGTPTLEPARHPHAPTAAVPPAESEGGWVLEGTDAAGGTVRLTVGRSELLRATRGPEKGLILGRSHSLSNKVLSDGSVSRRHARLVDVDGSLGIEDLSSTYGTTVNGAQLTPYNAVKLDVGAGVTLGDVTLELKALPAP
jgi:S1-C subfamily serine protease